MSSVQLIGTTYVDLKGRIVIPRDIREEAGLSEGEKLRVSYLAEGKKWMITVCEVAK